MNRSKSSNLFSTPSYLQYDDYQDQYAQDNPQQLTDRLFKNECVDLKWIKSLQQRKVNNKKVKLHRGYSDLHKISRQYALGHEFTGFVNLKQERDDYIVQNQQKYLGKVRKYKIKEKQRLPFQNVYVSEYPEYIIQSPVGKQQYRSLDGFKNKKTFSTGTNGQQQSTREEQIREEGEGKKEIQFLKKKAKKLEKGIHMLKQQKKLYGIKMLQYEIQIDKLKYEIENYKLNQSRQNSCEASICSYQNQIDSLQQALCEETETKQSLIKQRNDLLTQLSDALKNNDLQNGILKQQLRIIKEQKNSIQQKQAANKQQLNNLKEQLQFNVNKLKQLQINHSHQQQQIKQKKGMLRYLQQQVQRLANQNITLNNQTQILVESLQSVREQIQNARHWNNQFQLVIRQKEKLIEDYKSQIQKLTSKMEQCAEESQFLRRLVSCNENNVKQHQVNLTQKNQEIKDLLKQINFVKQENQSLKKLLKNKPKSFSPSVADMPIAQESRILQMICSTLRLPQDCDEEQILCEIQKLISLNNLNGQIANDYYDILQMFNVSLDDQSCHEKLLSQICEFRNHATILLKKVSNLQKKLWSVNEQNSRLVYKIKHGQIEQVMELERLVQEQNQQILKYRIHLSNLSVNRQAF